jgi:hypothetical protein
MEWETLCGSRLSRCRGLVKNNASSRPIRIMMSLLPTKPVAVVETARGGGGLHRIIVDLARLPYVRYR